MIFSYLIDVKFFICQSLNILSLTKPNLIIL